MIATKRFTPGNSEQLGEEGLNVTTYNQSHPSFKMTVNSCKRILKRKKFIFEI